MSQCLRPFQMVCTSGMLMNSGIVIREWSKSIIVIPSEYVGEGFLILYRIFCALNIHVGKILATLEKLDTC